MVEEMRTLVLGIGNLLWADEGFGVRALQALHSRYSFPESVQLVDGGTQGLYLLPWVQAANRMIVFDAVDFGREPGTLVVLRDAEIPAYVGVNKMSLHQSSFEEVLSLAMLSGHYPRDSVLIGVQPRELADFGGSLRPEVSARVDDAIQCALEALAAWGTPGTPRTAPADEIVTPGALDRPAYESGRPDEDAASRVGDGRFLALRAGRPS
jgi:hydrogenase maturation protease